MTTPRMVEGVVCPFCSLACDDLVLMVDGVALQPVQPACPIAAHEFARPLGDGACRIDGAPAELAAAIARAAEILAGARLPLLAGLGTDVAGVRAALALAERLGGVVDHAGTAGLLANVRTTQDEGWVTATLAEVRNRADLVLFVGTDASRVMPGLVEHVLRPSDGLFGPLARELVYLGDGLTPVHDLGPVTALPCAPARLPAVLASLRAAVAGHGGRQEELAALAGRLRAARYPVIVWAAGELPGGHPDLLVGALAGLIRELNRQGRCVGLPLAGPDNVIGVNQVCAWQTGVPLRTSLAAGVPDHDPVRWSTATLLASGAIDALLWIGSLRELPPPAVDVPTVALLRSGIEPGRPVEVLIPVGTPGLDHVGSLYRTDGVVAVPVRELRTTGLPSVATVLGHLLQACAA